MRIAIIGAGNVGGTLGRKWAAAGHEVVIGSRKPEQGAVSLAAAAAQSEVVVLSTPWPAVDSAIAACGSLAGKILIDCTNPLLPDLSGIELGTTTSGAEHVASLAPGAFVVKAFNSTGFNVMADPIFDGKPVTMFYCGDDPTAKAAVHELIADIGFDPIDAGPLTQARVLEPFAFLWISLAYRQGLGREIAFRFIKR